MNRNSNYQLNGHKNFCQIEELERLLGMNSKNSSKPAAAVPVRSSLYRRRSYPTRDAGGRNAQGRFAAVMAVALVCLVACQARAGEVMITDHGAKGDGRSNDTRAVTKAIEAVGGGGGTLIFPTGAYVVGDLDFPARCEVRFQKGASLHIGPNSRVAFHGQVNAGTWQIFSGPGSVKFEQVSERAVLPQWWGAASDYYNDDGSVNPHATDSAPAFQAALNSLPDVLGNTMPEGGLIRVPPGGYKLGADIMVKANSTTIQGDALSSQLIFTGWGGSGISFKHGPSDFLHYCLIRNLSMYSATVDRVLDISGASYGLFDNLVIESKKDNSSCIYGQGDNGSSPYYNCLTNLAS